MTFVHRQCEGVKSELDLFTAPPTQNSIVDSRIVEHQPMASLDSGGPIEFLIPGLGDDYLDLANTMLHMQVKVTRADGDDLLLALPVGFAIQSSRRLPERYARDPFDQHVRVSCLHRDAAELRHRCQGHSANGSTVAQGHGHSHGCRRDRRRTRG